jgi:hypothetical protein
VPQTASGSHGIGVRLGDGQAHHPADGEADQAGHAHPDSDYSDADAYLGLSLAGRSDFGPAAGRGAGRGVH